MKRLLVANRGEIACRILTTARELGIATVAVYSDADRLALHPTYADRAIALGPDDPAPAYLDMERVIAAARESGADAIHPGYGFLAESAAFAAAVEKAGLTFVGPSAEAITAMGDKLRARELAERCKLPVLPATTLSGDAKKDAKASATVGFPLIVKAAAGGGGRGMRVVHEKAELAEAIASARREAASAFGDDRVYLERYVSDPHHVEVQVFGDGRGHVLALGERECSVQRRHQKIIEEAPAVCIDDRLRAKLADSAIELCSSIDYRGAGTVEFIVSTAGEGEHFFLEMNTRLQVEHPVTEAVFGIDLVRWQLEAAAGGKLPDVAPTPRGHAIECRVCAEDPSRGFLPTAGTVHRLEHPSGPGIRVDSCLYEGLEIPVAYDSLLAKVIAWGPDREQARRRMIGAIERFVLLGVRTNVEFLAELLASAAFKSATFTTSTLDRRDPAVTADATASSAHEENIAIATAAAALAASNVGAAVVGSGAARATSGPWERLGAWRLGGGSRS
jgi:acetyl-CoA/propionyl-CoA carboxylase biotin carboxyl carrier protein